MLTNLQLHARTHEPTASFERASEKALAANKEGRVYGHLPKPADLDIDEVNHTMKIPITLPPDLMEQVQRGEVELALPEGGLPVYMSKDAQELSASMNRKQRRQAQFKKHRTRTWRSKR